MRTTAVICRGRPAPHARREPLVTLDEAAHALGLPVTVLRRSSPPAEFRRRDTGTSRNYYRLSVLRKWVADLKVTP